MYTCGTLSRYNRFQPTRFATLTIPDAVHTGHSSSWLDPGSKTHGNHASCDVTHSCCCARADVERRV